MTSARTQPDPPPIGPALGQARRRRLHQAAALALIALGGLLLAANLGLLRPDARQAIYLAWGLILFAVGLWLVAARLRPAAALSSFAFERGQTEQASLRAVTGATDLRLQALANPGQLAAGEYAGPGQPRMATTAGAASLRLDARHSWPLPVNACWPLALAQGLPWSLDLESTLGDYDLDLRDIQVSALRLYSTFGQVELTLPAAGAASVDLDLAFGDLTVRVPDGMAVKVRLKAGPLSNFVHDERRFVRLAPDEWVTPLYAVAANRCTLAVRLWAGDLRLL